MREKQPLHNNTRGGKRSVREKQPLHNNKQGGKRSVRWLRGEGGRGRTGEEAGRGREREGRRGKGSAPVQELLSVWKGTNGRVSVVYLRTNTPTRR